MRAAEMVRRQEFRADSTRSARSHRRWSDVVLPRLLTPHPVNASIASRSIMSPCPV